MDSEPPSPSMRRPERSEYFAPAISGSHHLTEGYFPCRAAKNVSYGAFLVTNNKRVHQVFGERGIFNPDPDVDASADPVKVSVAKVGEYYIDERKYDLDGAIAELPAVGAEQVAA